MPPLDRSASDELDRSRQVVGLWESEQGTDGLTKTISTDAALSALASELSYLGSDSLLPLSSLLELKGKPYSLRRHFPMEPMFNLDLPQKILWKCGRQVSKSTTLAAQGILMTSRVPHFSTIFVTPLYEQIRRFSSNYIRPFLKNGLIGQTMMDIKTEDTVLQKTFLNQSRMYFTFAYLDCERARGLSGDKLVIDEVQNMNPDFIPIIAAGLDASEEWGIEQYSGTPKTLDNAIEVIWEESSQAEWIMKCPHCGHWNEPNLAGGLLEMVQPKGLSCSKCKKVGVDPMTGQWKHMIPDRYYLTAGYHVPQPILPMHYAIPERWDRLYAKKIGQPPAIFMNEVLGESCDVGAKLVTLQELKDACTLPIANDYNEAVQFMLNRPYVDIAMGVDWGGGGLDEISLTAVAMAGLLPNGEVEIPYLLRMRSGYRQNEEAEMLLRMYWQFRASIMGHDFGGAGSSREVIMITAGLQAQHIMPFLYTRVRGEAIVSHKRGAAEVRSWYSIGKARTLLMMCSLIRAKFVHFPKYDSCKEELKDFLALIEDKISSRLGSDIYIVTRNARVPDDLAHATNFAMLALFHKNNHWPKLSEQFSVDANAEILSQADPRLGGDVEDYDPYTNL